MCVPPVEPSMMFLHGLYVVWHVAACLSLSPLLWAVFGSEFLYEVYTIHMHGFSVVCIGQAFTQHAGHHSLQDNSTAH